MIPVARALCRLCVVHSLSWIAKTPDGNVVGCCLCEPFGPDVEETEIETETKKRGATPSSTHDKRRRSAQEAMGRALAAAMKIAPVFELLEHVDRELLRTAPAGVSHKNTLHIIAAAVNEAYTGHAISTVLACKAVRHAQRVRGVTHVAQEATGAASQHIIRRSLGHEAVVDVTVRYDEWTRPSQDGAKAPQPPFRSAPTEYVLGRIDRLAPLGSITSTFLMATTFLSCHRPTREKLTNAQSLALFGLYKQGVFGDAPGDTKSFSLSLVARAKRAAWTKLRGTSNENAMRRFVRIVRDSEPAFADIIEYERHILGGGRQHSSVAHTNDRLLLSYDSFGLYGYGHASVDLATTIGRYLNERYGEEQRIETETTTREKAASRLSNGEDAAKAESDDGASPLPPTRIFTGSKIISTIVDCDIARNSSEALETASLLVEYGILRDDADPLAAATFANDAKYRLTETVGPLGGGTASSPRTAAGVSKIAEVFDGDASVVSASSSPVVVMLSRRHWISDRSKRVCMSCTRPFNVVTRRKHHCRLCGAVVCDACSKHRRSFRGVVRFSKETESSDLGSVRVCGDCAALDLQGVQKLVSAMLPKGLANGGASVV